MSTLALGLVATSLFALTHAADHPVRFKRQISVAGAVAAPSALNPPISIGSSDVQALKTLYSAVDGRLYLSDPLAAPCFKSFNGVPAQYNATACAAVQAGYQTDTTFSSAPGGYENPNWATCQATNQGCLLWWQDPSATVGQTCYQGSVPSLYIDVQQASDVQAAFNFTQATGANLVVKNTGHDYRGRSSAPASLMLWTHNLQSLSLSKSFTPAGCSASYTAITTGAGVQFKQVTQFADENGYFVVAGASYTVGISGGWIAGGGHGALSNSYGLGVDNVLEFEVVVPTGQHLIASRCQNTDLFFALAGGGGSTFGVVLSATYIAHPNVPIQVAFIAFEGSAAIAEEFTDIIVDNSLAWVQQNWGGYASINPLPAATNAFIFLNPNISNAQAVQAMQPLTSFASSLGNGTLANVVVTCSSFYEAYTTYITVNGEAEPVGLPMAIGSRLIPDTNYKTSAALASLSAAMKQALAVNTPSNASAPTYGGPMQMLFVSPYNFASTGYTSETPAWRNTVVHLAFAAAWDGAASTTQKKAAYNSVDSAVQIITAITPNSGTYQNEASVHTPNYQTAFWGAANYAKLSTIKKQYDPSNLLTCWQCIGWNQNDSRYSCYI